MARSCLTCLRTAPCDELCVGTARPRHPKSTFGHANSHNSQSACASRLRGHHARRLGQRDDVRYVACRHRAAETVCPSFIVRLETC